MEEKYGTLLNKDAKLHRQWFKEMTSLLGINVIYRSPKDNTKTYDGYGELDTYYNSPIQVGCIFEDHPSQKTMRRMGWNVELQEDESIIHLPYDLEGLQKGALVIVPSGIDNTKGRLFRINELSNIMVYPSSYACKIAPIYKSNFDRSQLNVVKTNMNLLNEEED